MSTPRFAQVSPRRWLLFAAALMSLGLAAFAAAARQDAELRAAVEARFQVVPIRQGVLLVPLTPIDGVPAIEVGSGEVAVAGRASSESDLERLVGGDAELVLALADLDEEELAELFSEGAGEEPELEEYEPVPLPDVADLEPVAEAPKPPPPPRHPGRDRRHRRHSDSRVVFGSSVHVEPDEVVDQVVAIGGAVNIEGEVDGDVVAVGGHLTISGTVTGDAVAIGGGAHLASTAVVDGTLTTVGSGLEREPGAEVGEVTEVSLWDNWSWGDGWDWDWGSGWTDGWAGPWWSFHDFRSTMSDAVQSIFRVLVLGLFGALTLLLARGSIEGIAARAAAEGWKAGAIGLAALLFFVPALIIVIVLLAVSIVGIPLLILVPFAVLGFILAALFGYFSVAYRVGLWAERRFGWRVSSPYVALFLGLLLIHCFSLLADMLDVFDGPRDVVGFLVVMLMLSGFSVKLCAWSVGLGSVILGRVGTVPLSSAFPLPPAPGDPASEELPSGLSDEEPLEDAEYRSAADGVSEEGG